jgi:putative DNA primase/helicase
METHTQERASDQDSRLPNFDPRRINTARIPLTMRELRQWVNWRHEERNGKPTKVPCRPDGKPGSTTDPKTWSTLEEVLRPSVQVAGIGFVFSGEVDANGLCIGGIDFDALNKRLLGETDDSGMFGRRRRANRFVREAQKRGAYVELSPSGGGLHTIGLMRPLSQGVKRNNVEVYTSGRFFTVTARS